MDEPLTERRVICRPCRYRFPVEASAEDDWRGEEQCPVCETWACFTAADTRDPTPAELEAEAQRLGEVLWQPIDQHRDHRAAEWLDRVGNGVFEDDHMFKPWPIPMIWVYRFSREAKAAYILQEGRC